MASISKNGSRGHHKFTLTVNESSYSIANNTSAVTFNFSMGHVVAGYDWNYSSKCVTCKCTINGNTYTKKLYKYGGSGTVTLASGTITVPHNSDGKKTISFSFSVSDGIGASYTPGSASASGSLALTNIPRVSDISVSPTAIDADGTSEVIATATKKYSSFTDTITVTLGDYSQEVTSGEAFTIPEEWINAIPGTSATAAVTVTTKNGSTTIGTKTANLTVNVPEDIKPTISAVAVTEAVTSVTQAFGNRFVKTLSKLNVAITAAGIYGSTISSYSTEFEGTAYLGQTFQTNALNSAGSINMVTTVIDSRGRSVTYTKSVTVVDYTLPTITDLSYVQCNSDGTPNSSGSYTKVTISGKVASVESQNSKTLVLKYKALNSETYTTRTLTVTDWEFTVSTVISGTDPTVTYEYIAELSDKIGSTQNSLVTGVPVISALAGGGGLRLFAEAVNKGFWVGNIDMTITDEEFEELEALLSDISGGGRLIDWILPIGSVIANANPDFDPNLLYQNMTWERFAKGQTLVGVNEDDEDFSAADKTGGEKTHKLTTAEMPSHSHRYQYLTNWDGRVMSGFAVTGSSTGSNNQSVYAAGGDEPHNNMPPYVTVYYWRRIA